MRRAARYISLLVVSAGFLAYGKANAQQNLFNVPSSEITDKGKLFFQQQLNVTKEFTSSTTLAYGLGKQFEVGFNLFDVALSRPRGIRQRVGEPTLDPAYLFTAQKRFEVNETLDWAIGTQLGGKLSGYGSSSPRNYTYLNTIFELPDDRARFVIGPYYSHLLYNGSNNLGFQLGLDLPIIREKVHFIGDFISGQNALSVGTAGLVFFLPHDWQLSAGVLLPAPGSPNQYGAVFEFTHYRPKSKNLSEIK